MQIVKELQTLYQLFLGKKRGKSHAELLESFYGPQAEDYDRFRKRLLPGRKAMIHNLKPKGGIWVDLGGGTASNLEYVRPHIDNFDRIYIVDLSSALLEQAKKRVQKNGWKNISLIHEDATNFRLPEGQSADYVSFSYSLTMIPNWYSAIENAKKLLKKNGRIGVVDFTVHRNPNAQESAKEVISKGFWQTWFSWDRVYLSSDHLPFLQANFAETISVQSKFSPPYIGLLPISVPYYWFVGQKN